MNLDFIDSELIRINILFELYQSLLNIKSYDEIQKQEYEIEGCNKSKVIAALYYLNDKGFIGVRSGKSDNTLKVFIKARGIDDIEDRLNKGLIFLYSDFTYPVLRLYVEKPKNQDVKDNKSNNNSDNNKSKNKDNNKK